jgi:hypothetical protein
MPGQFYATGAMGLYVGAGSGGSYLFLGHGRRAPRQQVMRQFGQVMCDLGGQKTYSDRIVDGVLGRVSVTLTRYSMDTLRTIQDVARTGAGAGNAAPAGQGAMAPLELGTLLMTEGVLYPLVITTPFGAKAAYAAGPGGAMGLGRTWYGVTLDTPDDDEGGLGQAREVTVVFECQRVLDPLTGIWGLYSNTVPGGLPAF